MRRFDKDKHILNANKKLLERHSKRKVIITESIMDVIKRYAGKIAKKLSEFAGDGEETPVEKLEQEIIQKLPPQPTPEEVKKIATELVQRYYKAAKAMRDNTRNHQYGRADNLIDGALRKFKGTTLTIFDTNFVIDRFELEGHDNRLLIKLNGEVTNVLLDKLVKKLNKRLEMIGDSDKIFKSKGIGVNNEGGGKSVDPSTILNNENLKKIAIILLIPENESVRIQFYNEATIMYTQENINTYEPLINLRTAKVLKNIAELINPDAKLTKQDFNIKEFY